MKLPNFLSEHKAAVHKILLAIQVSAPIMMFIGIQNGWIGFVFLGLIAIILANLTASLTK